ncbi:hypothetical protein LLG96_13630 [bacterium]|nr:hypothetical protein [bacterium]
MKRNVAYFLVFVLFFAVPARAEWRMDEFMIFLFGANNRAPDAEQRIRAIADAGFNIIDGDRDKLDLCKKYGLKLLVHGVSPEDAPSTAKHPALWGYHIIDEPLHNLPALLKLHRAYRAADPDHLDYSNLISLGGEYLSSYMETIQPRILSYDYYQYWWGTNGHFTKLELYRKAALDAGVPLVVFFEVDSSPEALWGSESGKISYRPDNRERIREGVYTALAYGIKGVEWFWAGMMFKPGTSELNECGKDVAAINAELKVLGPVLMKLHSVDVFHTEPLPRDAKAIPEEHWIQVFSHGYPGLVLGTFKDDKEIDYAMVCNTNCEGRQIVAMEIRRKFPVAKIEKFDRKNGTWIPLPITEILSEKSRNKIAQAYDFYMYSQRTGGDNITYRDINERWTEKGSGKQLVEFELAPGDGELFRITKNLDFKTIRQEGKNY